MNQITDAMDMIDHLHQMAFCVRDCIIVKANAAASNRMIETGMQIEPLLKTGAEEYRDFSDGCLYLTLNICGQELGFSVNHKNGFDLFQLEKDESDVFRALALAAREMREPLSAIMIASDRLFSKKAGDSDTNMHIGHMNRATMQLLRLISNLSDAGKYADAESVPKQIENVPVLLDEIFAKAAAAAEHIGKTVSYNGVSENILMAVNAELLERAVLHIIDNALIFTPAGGIIQASLQRRGSKLLLSIQDNGCGIDENIRANLFSRYTREPGLEESRTGIGLGLVFARSAARHHGGTVLVDQPEACSTRITLMLPIQSGKVSEVRTKFLTVDYAAEHDHIMMEFSNIMPPDLYVPQ